MTPQCSGRGPTITIGMIWLTVLLWLSFTVFCDADPGGTVGNIYNILSVFAQVALMTNNILKNLVMSKRPTQHNPKST